MSQKNNKPSEGIKRSMFGGLNAKAVNQILEGAEADKKLLHTRIDSTIAELGRIRAEADQLKSNEASYKAQLETARADLARARAEFETQLQELRDSLAHQQDQNSTQEAERIGQLQSELASAYERLNEVPSLQAEVETLRFQLAQSTQETNDHQLGEEIEQLRSQAEIIPQLQQHIAELQAQLESQINGQLDRSLVESEEIERLSAQVSNVPNLLQEIETLRAELASSPSTAESEELLALRAEVERLHEQHAMMVGGNIDLDRTLVEARRILDDSRTEAEREREIIIEAAHHHAEEIVRRAQRQFSTEAWEIEKIRLERRRYLSMFKALLNRHLHEVEELEAEPAVNDMNEVRPKFATVSPPDGEPSAFAKSFGDSFGTPGEAAEEFRSPFSYPQADEPFRA